MRNLDVYKYADLYYRLAQQVEISQPDALSILYKAGLLPLAGIPSSSEAPQTDFNHPVIQKYIIPAIMKVGASGTLSFNVVAKPDGSAVLTVSGGQNANKLANVLKPLEQKMTAALKGARYSAATPVDVINWQVIIE